MNQDREIESLQRRLDALESRLGEEIAALRTRIGELRAQAKEKEKSFPPSAVPEWGPPPAPPPEEKPLLPPPDFGIPAVRPELPAAPPPAPPVVPAPPPVPAVPVAAMLDKPEVGDGPSLEMRFGQVWLVRLGIGLLITGLVLLGNFAYHNWIRDLSNATRLTGLLVCAGLLFETGRRLATRPHLSAFGEVVAAGGLSFFYYCVFASHHVARLRVIENPVIAGLLLAGAAALVAGVSWARQTKATAMLGLVMASYAVMLQPLGWLSCLSSVLIAAAGLFFMTRPGWQMPGWVSLLASYASFVGWQLMMRGNKDDLPLWFLPFVWMLFALPPVIARPGLSINPLSSARFAAVNNIAFFLLFSMSWQQHHGRENYWLVCLGMGLAILALGILGHRRGKPAADTNLGNGIGFLSLAIILKLDGWHLALGLAIEALALALSFWRFHTRVAMHFSLLASFGSAFLLSLQLASGANPAAIPMWSAALACLLLATASLVMNMQGAKSDEVRGDGDTAWTARGYAGMIFFAAMIASIVSWRALVDEAWQGCVAAWLAAAMCAGSFALDRKGRWPEPVAGSLVWMLLAGVAGLFLSGELIGHLLAASGFLAMCLVWSHWRDRTGELPPGSGQWPAALLSALLFARGIDDLDWGTAAGSFAMAGGGLGLLATALLTRASALAPAGALLGALSVASAMRPGMGSGAAFALAGLIALGFAAFALPSLAARMERTAAIFFGLLLRASFFCSWIVAWRITNPDHFGDWLVLSALIPVLVSRAWNREPPLESHALFAFALYWWGGILLEDLFPVPITPMDWRAWGLLITGGVLVFLGPVALRPLYGMLFCVIAAIYSTRLTLMVEGWRPVTVTWTVLGFVLVSAGLWGRAVSLRLGGFLLILLALIKVFAVDVWEFTAFTRVVSFIVLGVALLLLGLFYHKFVPALRGWIGGEDHSSNSG